MKKVIAWVVAVVTTVIVVRVVSDLAGLTVASFGTGTGFAVGYCFSKWINGYN